MINERAIFNALRYNANGDKRIRPMRVAIIDYLMYHKGYSRTHIAKALHREIYTIKHWQSNSDEYRETDIYAETIQALNNSDVKLSVRFENIIANIQDIRIYLTINNNEYKHKNINGK